MKKVFFDTDLGGDCDDVLALDLILSAERAGDCELLGVTYSAVVPTAPACIYAILKQHGREAVPIGRASEGYLPPHKTRSDGDCYASVVAKAFPDANAPTPENGTDAVRLLRRVLAENDRVTLIVTGYLTNMAALLRSEGDDISPLNGAELFRTRVAEVALMGGDFSHQNCTVTDPSQVSEDGHVHAHAECNIVSDAAASRAFIANCPAPIAFLPFEVGLNMISGKPMVEAGAGKTPDSLSFITHGSVNGRHSWDPATALYGIYGRKPWFYATVPGKVTVDEDAFTNFYPEKGGLHTVLACAVPQADIGREIDRLVMQLY